ncbi:MAG: THUMP domain-containing protein [Bacteroidia bacterium]|nr:THUMP domain-containing protein [Bacteroidia bacterium]
MSRNSTNTNPFFFIAKTFQGLEEVLAHEIQGIGGSNIRILKRAVSFEGDKSTMYKANMFLRTAVRVLRSIKDFEAFNERQLYEQVYQIPWENFMEIGQTFTVDAVTGSHLFKNSHFVALKTKDALVDRFRKREGKRPSVDLQKPDLRIHINIQGNMARLYLDSSGNSLHLRGYRKAMTKAPLSEILAAGMILLSGWDGKTPFFDPMCGSGTLPIEASLIASNTAPGLFRKSFGFFSWIDFEEKLWQKIVDQALEQETELTTPIYASDISPLSIKISTENMKSAGFEDDIKLEKISFQKAPLPCDSGFLIMNPPYDQRLFHQNIQGFYKEIGDHLKQTYKGWTAWIISSNMEAMKRVGLKPSKRVQLFNGPLQCKYQGYELY